MCLLNELAIKCVANCVCSVVDNRSLWFVIFDYSAAMQLRFPQNESLRTGIAAAAASVCFGISVVATRFVVAETQPVSLAFMRYAIGAACLLPVMWRVESSAMPRRDVLAIAA